GGYKRIQPVAMLEPQPLVGAKIDPQLGFYGCYLLAQPQRVDQILPVTFCERDDHHAAAILGAEVTAEGTEDVITHARAILAGNIDLRYLAEMTEACGGDIAERYADFLALSGQAAVSLCSQQSESGIGAGHEVPRRQHVVYGCIAKRIRPCHQGNSHGTVDRVIDGRRAVRPAHDTQGDHV